ncbi:hypothetical protein ACJIZ3_021827 [Penstemon smallii]|uniref:Myb-like domain-containing protein n=1 Tax=Penstemon smallii TaxID=265156 RepID=A0ABD3SN83_9LAMI
MSSSDLRELISGSPLLETTTTSTTSGTGRWRRQETLNLLEIRSRLDPKFKDLNANHKSSLTLWDEVSRIMSEGHGYERSGRKCKEKFDNLYKYYKRTKHAKAGRQDAKHYRHALYGETNNSGGNFHYNFSNNKNTSLLNTNNQESYLGSKLSDTSLGQSNLSDSDASSSEDSDKRKKRSRKSWKVKVKNLINTQMKRLMDKQEEWMEKMMNTIERKEQDRILSEEEWRKQDAARTEQEHKLWASERAWIEARDCALIDSLYKITGKGLMASKIENQIDDVWPEGEITRLIHLRSEYQQCGIPEEAMWDEISNKMACFGHDRSALMCKQKWDNVNSYLLKCNKKREEGSICNQSGGGGDYSSEQRVDHVSSPPNDNRGNSIHDSCFRYFIGDTNY